MLELVWQQEENKLIKRIRTRRTRRLKIDQKIKKKALLELANLVGGAKIQTTFTSFSLLTPPNI